MPHDRSLPARDVASPQPGYFQIRMVRRGPWVPARILLRADGAWQAIVNGEVMAAAADPAWAPMVFRIWHGGQIITEPEYLRLLRLKGWADAHDPSHPAANPNKPVDLTKANPIF